MLALPSAKNFCALHGRRASSETAIKPFTGMVENPPSPFISTLVKNEQTQSPVSGQIQTLSYEWSASSATRKMLFTLTTATSESAQLQVLGSAAIISQ
ncbi:NMCC_0638 family (lipo)protein [Pseudomonas sp. TMB3-21]